MHALNSTYTWGIPGLKTYTYFIAIEKTVWYYYGEKEAIDERGVGISALNLHSICDTIKRNESDVRDIVFEILAKKSSNYFV